jgi:PKHD-type hydroxylase
MFLEVPDLLSSDEVRQLREYGRTLKFVDGRVSNPNSKIKNNLHADQQDPDHNKASEILGRALGRNDKFLGFAFPKRMAPPVLTKYQPGMHYGAHADSAFLPLGQPRPLRADLSCTIFLNNLADYDGGELCVRLGTREVDFKLAPGGAVIYPSTTIHEVRPVTRGERLCGITFIESEIVDRNNRELLFELQDVVALEGDRLSWEARTRLSFVTSSLHRQWGDAA